MTGWGIERRLSGVSWRAVQLDLTASIAGATIVGMWRFNIEMDLDQ